MTKYEDWKAFTKIFMKATKKKREKLPKNSSNKNLTQSNKKITISTFEKGVIILFIKFYRNEGEFV
ncbi:hypothetical protein ABE25_17425 [Cytobacillus firmus]|nr:hypothetical protein [Cytobacillus firmus]MBG9603882.1 hypothetical protein [Cytobacillus firmus]